MKIKIDLNGSFRGAFYILIEEFLGKSTIADRPKYVPGFKTLFYNRFRGICFLKGSPYAGYNIDATIFLISM